MTEALSSRRFGHGAHAEQLANKGPASAPGLINEEEMEVERNAESLVREFYAALACNDADAMRALLVEDLEWWFHGPPSERHLMRMLTGAKRLGSFAFVPQRVSSIGCQVFVEGQGATAKACWVHVWTVKKDRLAELREYFNTSVTVTGVLQRKSASFNSKLLRSQSSDQFNPFDPHIPIWQSKFTGHSMPELILAI